MKSFLNKIRWPLYVIGLVLAVGGIILAWSGLAQTLGAISAVTGFVLLGFSGYVVRIQQGISVLDWLRTKFGKQ